MQSDLQSAQMRALQYWFIDGLAELGLAAFCLLLAIVFWVQGSLPRTGLGDMLFFAGAFAGGYGIRWVLLRVKERSTYPRTGYVKPARSKSPTALVVTAIFAIIVLAANLFLSMSGQAAVAWMPLVAGFIFAFIFLRTGMTLGFARFTAFGLVSLAGGGVLSLSGLGDLRGCALLAALVGLALLGSGLLTRRDYLRRTTPPAGDDEAA